MFSIAEKLEILKSSRLFETLPYDGLHAIALTSEEIICPKGEILFEKGDEAFHAYLLFEGEAEAFRTLEDGREVELARFRKGDVFGEFGILSSIPRTASVRIIENFRGLAIERDIFLEILRSYPEASIRIMDVLVMNLLRVENKMLALMGGEKKA